MIFNAVWDKVVNDKDFSESWEEACENPALALLTTATDVISCIPAVGVAGRVAAQVVQVTARTAISTENKKVVTAEEKTKEYQTAGDYRVACDLLLKEYSKSFSKMLVVDVIAPIKETEPKALRFLLETVLVKDETLVGDAKAPSAIIRLWAKEKTKNSVTVKEAIESYKASL